MLRLTYLGLAFILALNLNACQRYSLQRPSMVPPPDFSGQLQVLKPANPATRFKIELKEQTDEYSIFKFEFASSENQVSELSEEGSAQATSLVAGEYYQASSASSDAPAPLLQIAPILGGALNDYFVSRLFAEWAAEEGFSSFFLYQKGVILEANVTAKDMQEMLVTTTHENVQAIEALAQRPEVDAQSLACFGVSLGAIKNVLLLAAMPNMKGGVFCLAGGDLPRIFKLSREMMVEDYFIRRAETEGSSRETIQSDLDEHLKLDPLDVAEHIGSERALLYIGTLDDKVHYLSGLALYQALGRPELQILPLGHYTGIIMVPKVANEGFRWLKKRFKDPS